MNRVSEQKSDRARTSGGCRWACNRRRVASPLCLGLELLVPLGDLLPEPLDGHQAAVLQRGLVHRAVGALPHDFGGGAQQVVGCERQRPIKVHQLAAHIATGFHLPPQTTTVAAATPALTGEENGAQTDSNGG
jgi:hypothetical protein